MAILKQRQLTEEEAKAIAQEVASDLLPHVISLLNHHGIACVYTIALSKFLEPHLSASIDTYLSVYGDPSREEAQDPFASPLTEVVNLEIEG